MTKRNLYKILFLVCFWEMCALFIAFYDSTILGFKSEIGAENYSLPVVLAVVFVVCLVGASLLGSIEVLFLGKILRKKALGLNLVVKTTVYITFIFIFSSSAFLFVYSSELSTPVFSKNVLDHYASTFLDQRALGTMSYWGIACVLALFILHINDKFGQGVLFNFLLGRYHKPKEQSRIFMFMDLKSSTTHAEKLGHLKYSQLIQDCFYDLTDVVLNYDAKIYQYVGDEVVLSWDYKNGLRDANCIKTFFAYEQILKKKSHYYKKKYGLVPEFKAGINLGSVMVAEVGEIKKELAYHGDVLNTAARIQGKCNDYEEKLLVSELLKSEIGSQQHYEYEYLGEISLRGKEQSVNIYSVTAHE